MLGAGIRLGEAISAPRRERPELRPSEPEPRTDRQEPGPGWQNALSGIVERMDRQQNDLNAVKRQISGASRVLDSMGGMAADLRGDLHRELSEDLERRLAAVEQSLHLSLEAANRQTANAMVESIERKLAPRIERLESELSGQAASVAELRDCALQSERSILRLLTVLEKNVSSNGAESPRLSVVRPA